MVNILNDFLSAVWWYGNYYLDSFCVYWSMVSMSILIKAALHRKHGKTLTNIPREMYKWSSTKKAISKYRSSNIQISGFAISSYKNIQMDLGTRN